MLRIMKSLVVVAAALAVTAYAEEKAPAADAAKGEALFAAGVPSAGVPACVGCHGDGGNSVVPANPKLAGQHAAYIVKQLQNFRDKYRENAIMSPYAAALSDEDMRNIAAYVSKQSTQPGAAKNKDTILLGQKIYRGGIADKGVPACAGCHGPNGSGIPVQYPRIGSQWADYVESQLSNFRSGARKNNAQMMAIAAKLSDAEIKAVSDYIGGLH